jgi:hypothetical protein
VVGRWKEKKKGKESRYLEKDTKQRKRRKDVVTRQAARGGRQHWAASSKQQQRYAARSGVGVAVK